MAGDRAPTPAKPRTWPARWPPPGSGWSCRSPVATLIPTHLRRCSASNRIREQTLVIVTADSPRVDCLAAPAALLESTVFVSERPSQPRTEQPASAARWARRIPTFCTIGAAIFTTAYWVEISRHVHHHGAGPRPRPRPHKHATLANFSPQTCCCTGFLSARCLVLGLCRGPQGRRRRRQQTRGGASADLQSPLSADTTTG